MQPEDRGNQLAAPLPAVAPHKMPLPVHAAIRELANHGLRWIKNDVRGVGYFAGMILVASQNPRVPDDANAGRD